MEGQPGTSFLTELQACTWTAPEAAADTSRPVRRWKRSDYHPTIETPKNKDNYKVKASCKSNLKDPTDSCHKLYRPVDEARGLQ